MSSDFNPYREWLSIPLSEQPANYYRLLGVPLFEPDPNVISNAADRQMTFIRTFQMGKYAKQSQQILNELAAARVTLLNKQKKAQYDAKLRAAQGRQSPSINTPADNLLNNNKKHSTPSQYTPSATPSAPIAMPSATPSAPIAMPSDTPSAPIAAPSDTPSAPIAAPPLIPSNTPSVPSRTPLLTPSLTMSVPSITPPSTTPHVISITPPPPVPQSPTDPSAAPQSEFSQIPLAASHRRSSKNKDVPPLPSSSSKDTQNSAESKTSNFKKRWIAVLFSIIAIPLIIFGSVLLLNHDKFSSQGTRPQEKKLVFEPGVEPGERKSIKINGVEFAFCWCPPGTFMMGSPENEEGRKSDETQHEVTLTKGFWMMETEVTQKQWQAVMGDNPSNFIGDDLPVDQVSWTDCQEFCKKCTQLGMPIMLPTEAQWEYACRAGTKGMFAGDVNDMAWYFDIADNRTHPVGTTKPNAWGLYDMHGNVREWCQDKKSDYPNESVIDPAPSSIGAFPYPNDRVTRGGSWCTHADICRSAARSGFLYSIHNKTLGVRCVNSTDEESSMTEEIASADDNEKNTDGANNVSKNKKAGDRAVKVVNGVKFVFRWCPPGTFIMGSPEDEAGRVAAKQHEVTLTKGFWILETEVTQKQWQAIMGENPSYFVGEDNPVDNVSWKDCQDFFRECAKFGLQAQLPTEAQWEYACRAGATGELSGDLDEMEWFGDNSGKATHPVGTKKPNPWGLYDMIGNVEEWCQDWHADYPDGSVTDPTGPSNGSYRMGRGGCWRYGTWACSYHRGLFNDYFSMDFLGFRFVSLTDLEPAKPGEIEALEKQERESANNKKKTKPVVDQEYFQSGKNAGDRVVRVVNGVEFVFRWCPPGDFMMGTSELEDEREADEKQHEVTLTKGFWIMETEVTQKQWKAIMGNNPSYYKGDDLPVEWITWNDCQEFCEKCAELGFPVQLPTEAQWEYACRAGTTGAYAGDLDEMAWYEDTSGNNKHPVKMKKPNAWGIYDMHGNVVEWCADWYDSYLIRRATDPTGPSTGSYRVVRSSRWHSAAKYCRSAYRSSDPPIYRSAGCGFRCVSPIESQSSDDQKETIDSQTFSLTGKRAGERAVVVVNDVEFVFCWCPAGSFLMGSPESEEGHREDETQHEVTITKGFWMLETEVTQKQWQAIMRENPSSFVSEDYPVENVSWEDCRNFCKECANLGFPVELPTEAQWEYACRAGTTGAFSGDLNEIAWNASNCDVFMNPCRTKKPNAWGLYDMHGNVDEWCQDWYSEDYPSGGITDPTGPSSGIHRVNRGGSWRTSPLGCRSAHRHCSSTTYYMDFLGFRCVSSLNMKLTKPREENINFDKCQNAGDRAVRVVNGIEFAFRWCPPGTYTMGSPESERGRWKRETQRSVVLTEGFWMMETEVTVGMFKAFVNETGYESKGNRPVGFDGKTWDTKSEYSWLNPGYKMEDSLPVSCISLEDAIEFGKWLESKIGYKVQLPLESQWEYACRAGTTGACAGNQDEMTWYDSNSKSGPHPVGTKKPNPWGLYDMHGNIGEWCLDLYDSNLGDNGDNNTEPQNGDYRVSRGGFWFSYSHYCRSAYRDFSKPDCRAAYLGFRLIIPFYSKLSGGVKYKTEPVPLKYFASGKTAGDRITRIVNGVEFAFRWCPPGDFMMGSPQNEDGHYSNERQHEVTLTKGFWIMETEVSQKQWKAIMGTNPSYYKGDDLPVEELTWNDCQEFCEKCAKLGFPVQLPTEAQWEYACRAGTTGAFAGDLDEIAWYEDTSGNDKHPVKTKKPNAWGIYDMHGNVDEWCEDWYGSYSIDDVKDPTGPSEGTLRVSRSGSWINEAKYCRSAYRTYQVPIRRDASQSFRCVSPPIKPKSSTTGKTEASDGQKETIDTQNYSKKAGDRAVKVVNGVMFVFRWCPAGTFMMGSPESEEGRGDNEKQHEVTLTKGFWMLETEVTQKQWEAIMGENPSSFVGEDLPVVDVSWDACQDFCDMCAELGFQVQLPTEAQWEYACRAGTTGAYSGEIEEMAWYGYNDCGLVTHPCGTKAPNPWGLYDMYGNAEEWCQDWYSKEYPSESVTDPMGPTSGSRRAIRGGCWRLGPSCCRSAFRESSYENYEINHLGFRIISLMNLEPAKPGEIESYREKEKKAKAASNKKETKSVVAQEYFASGKSAGDRVVKVVKGVEFAFRWCPPGDFMMGSPETENERLSHEKQHKVTLTKGFWMMETEVTQKQWQAIMGNNPSDSKGDNFPVNFVTWYNCQEFCEKCAELGFPVQLPTEAQWEYACRAGTTGAFADELDEIAWYEDNSGRNDHPVGTKKPNAWGLYDMHGSVREWCGDWYDRYSIRNVTDPTGPSDSLYRVVRGGCCYNEAKFCRSAHRSSNPPVQRLAIQGFRCMSPTRPESSTIGETGSSDGQKKTIGAQNSSKKTKKAGDRVVIVVKGVEFAFRFCPPGTFMMGSPESEEARYNTEVQHKVTLTKGFWMMETEVTQKQWQAIMGNNPSTVKGDNLPVTFVSWDDCQEFCKKCKELGLKLQLPTEAQWEYACRAGSDTAFSWGNVLNGDKANCKGNEPYGTTEKGQYLQKEVPVGSYPPNAWGLLDMHGNAMEWCLDWYGNYPNDSVTDPTGPSEGSQRVNRGGSYIHTPKGCRSAYRGYSKPESHISNVGVRFIRPILSLNQQPITEAN